MTHADVEMALSEDLLIDQARWMENTCCIQVPCKALNPDAWRSLMQGGSPCFG